MEGLMADIESECKTGETLPRFTPHSGVVRVTALQSAAQEDEMEQKPSPIRLGKDWSCRKTLNRGAAPGAVK